MDITRRSLVGTAAGLTACAALGLNVAAAVAATPEGQPIYEGSARGMRGHITVHVTLDGDRIADIQVVENTETPAMLSEAAITSVVPAMLEAQTTSVDAVAGATFSSMALMNAVAAALEAAGVAEQFSAPAQAPASDAPADTECDVLVVGSGLAGSNAAVAARYDVYGKQANDLNVILIEEMGITGGSSRLAGGTFGTTVPLNDTAAGVERLFEEEFPGMASEEFPISKELARNLSLVSGTNVYENILLGMPVVAIDGVGAADDFDYLVGWFDEPRPNPTVFGEGVWSFASWRIMQFMDERLEALGVDVRMNTKATGLVVENGAVTGVSVTTPAGDYTIRAKKVVLATGGFLQNPQMVAELAPTYVNAVKYCAAGSRGDGIAMATRDVDAVVDGYDAAGGPIGVNMVWGGWHDLGYDYHAGIAFPAGYKCVIVNVEGNRFMTDSGTLVPNEGSLPRTILAQPEGRAWTIFDSANEAAALADASVMQSDIYRADTLAALADLIGVPADALEATIAAYNEMAETGTDDAEFGVPAVDMAPVAQPPYLAIPCVATACFDTVGLRLGDTCEVVNSAGEAVPNLYAAGEVAYAGGTFSGLCGAFAMGRLAGDAAREALRG